MTWLKKTGFVFVALAFPIITWAQPTDFKGVARIITGFLSTLFPVLISMGLLVFFWGIVKYLGKAGGGDSTTAHKEGREMMLWGILALFVMVSIWGIVAFFQSAIFNRVLTLAS